jgi:hypothetical protein
MRIKGLPLVRSGLLRADDQETDGLGTLNVRFSPFNTWYEINSFWEGRFLERTVPGTFRKTIQDARRSDGLFNTKVLFNHGMDFNIGDKVLTVPSRFAEVNDEEYHGPELEGSLLDTSYNRDLLPGLRAGAYGSSFMFEVIRESWDNEPEASDHNPEGLPERTIQEARTFEAGPVTWPASPTATAGMRSIAGTDRWMERVQARDGRRFDDLVRSFEAYRTMYKTRDYRQVTPTPGPEEEPRRQVELDANQRKLALRRRRLDLMSRGR